MPSIDPRPFTNAEFELLEAHPDEDIAKLTLDLRQAANADRLPGLGLATPRLNVGKRAPPDSEDSSEGGAGYDSGYDSDSADGGVKYSARRAGHQVNTRRQAAPSKRAFTIADLTNRHIVDRLPTLFVEPLPREMHTAPLPIPLPRFDSATQQHPGTKPTRASPPANDRDTVLPSFVKHAAARGIGDIDERDDDTFRPGDRSAAPSLHDKPRSQAMVRASFDADSAAESLNAAVRGLIMAEEPRCFRDTVHTNVTDLSIDSMSQVSIGV